MERVITLLTDFGTRDPYVASMKGVILGINPEAKIVDITHQIPPQDILEAAYTLYTSYKYFTKGTIHVIVVDPGVGSRRRIIALKTRDYIFIAPDNGVLSLVLQKEKVKEIVKVTNKKYFLKPVSDTFHGRDIFSPVAAHLSQGVSFKNIGKRTKKIRELKISKPEVSRGQVIGRIIHIDRFGNLVTNIDKETMKSEVQGPMSKVKINIGKRRIRGIRKSYTEVKKGELLALFGSSGFLEISINLGNASKVLNVKKGEKIKVKVE